MSAEVKSQKPQPFESFQAVYSTLMSLGCCKLLYEPSNKWKLYLNWLLRFLYFAFTIFLNVQQLTFTFLYCKDLTSVMTVLPTEIPQLNLITKILTLHLGSSRLDKLHEVMNGPYFAPKLEKDVEYLNENRIEMTRLMKFVKITIIVCLIVWFLAHLFRKIQDGDFFVPLILPVDDNTWFGFWVYVLTMHGVCWYTGLGHLTTDCLVATYYSQATIQLKILKNDLEHMFDEEEVVKPIGNYIAYKGNKEQALKEHFVFCVKKYDAIAWFTRELNSVFNFSTSFQFGTTTAVTCFVIYSLSDQQKFSAQLIFLVTLLLIFQVQVFLYCYYGSLVEFESQSVSQYAFQSNWLALSPKFRRSLVIAMTRWTEPLRTRVSVVIPLSVSTSYTIIRSAYTLYTLMSKAAN